MKGINILKFDFELHKREKNDRATQLLLKRTEIYRSIKNRRTL